MSTFRILICVTIILSITAWWYSICLEQHIENKRISLHNYYISLMNSNPYHIKTVAVYDNDCYIIDVNYEE